MTRNFNQLPWWSMENMPSRRERDSIWEGGRVKEGEREEGGKGVREGKRG